MSVEAADTYNLERYLEAQKSTYDEALVELRAGGKRTHWMWFIFPQLAGLGTSSTAVRYAIGSLDEARAYLSHPILGPRLAECAEAVLAVQGKSATEIFGLPDDIKLRSSATLFLQVSPANSVFHWILDKYYSSEPDTRTLELLSGDSA
ncbi:MAG: DUF1810 domain-containing protein [Gemmatimonadaceae bacterium]